MRHQKGEPGQGLVEYALLIALVAIVSVAALSMMGRSLFTIFYGISEALEFGCGQVSAETFRNYAGEGGETPPGSISPEYFPAQGTITQSYWFCHTGLDVAGPQGTPVQAIADGTVKFAGWNDRGYGYLVVIDHGSYQSLYAHLRDTPSVSTGQAVNAGSAIGAMGNTGFSTGPHLHFEIRLGSELVDPASHLP